MKELIIVGILCWALGHVWVDCLNCTNFKVTFYSKNFECIWKWDEEKKLPSGTRYNVQYKRYGVKVWTDKSECQHISERFCNLTNEMTSETENFNYAEYFVRVKALSQNCSSDWVQSKRVNVKDDTIIGPPTLASAARVYSMKFILQPPHLFIPSNKTIEDVYYESPVKYHLSISSLKTKQTLPIVQTNKEFEVFGLDPDTDYNGTVYMSLDTEKNSESREFLVKTLSGDAWVLIVVALLASIMLFSVATLWFGYKYVNPPRQLPKSLDIREFTRCQVMDQNVTSYIHEFSKPVNAISPFSSSHAKQNPRVHLQESPLLLCKQNEYKSQGTDSAIPTTVQSSDQTNLSPVSYLSQETQNRVPSGNRSNNSSIIYGVCKAEVNAGWTNASQTDQMIQVIEPWAKIPQYRPQTESTQNYCSQSKPAWTPELLATLSDPRSESRDAEFSLEKEQQFQQMLLQQEKTLCQPCSFPLFPLFEEEHYIASNAGEGQYRPETTMSLSLLSSVKVGGAKYMA